MSEKNDTTKNIDLFLPSETERKFIPILPERLAHLRKHETATAIEQVYLSSPTEPFSLRLREYASSHDGVIYEATLKDRGEISAEGLKRLEVNTPISPELYNFYTSLDAPRLKKIRIEPLPGITVDYYEDGSLQVESENEEQWQKYQELYGDDFVEVTGLMEADNERRAYAVSNLLNENATVKPESLTKRIIEDILTKNPSGDLAKIVHIGGRSGSGKSTVVREIISELDKVGVSSALLSTDDYHRGQRWLSNHNNGESWTHWDDRIVYDLDSVKQDLQLLLDGSSIPKREIDWKIVESYSNTMQDPADVIIVEGIYATDPSITNKDDLTYVLPTPLATCVGRRLLRDIKERPQFANPAESLLYMLSEAEPAYRRQQSELSYA